MEHHEDNSAREVGPCDRVPASLARGCDGSCGPHASKKRWHSASHSASAATKTPQLIGVVPVCAPSNVGERSADMDHTRFGSDGYFSHERLAAYDLALAALEFVAARKAKLVGLPGGIGPQLERAVVGAYTNLCAGASAFGAESR